MRNTVAKKAILNILNDSDIALSQAEIQEMLPEGLCNRVTIYRVLNRLVDKKLAHEVVNIDGVVKYANCHCCSTEHRHAHIHFSCERCHQVTCIEKVEPKFNLPEHYTVHKVNFMVSGICDQCAS